MKPKSYKGPEIEVLVRSLSSSNDEAISKIIGYISEGNSKCRVGTLNEPAQGSLNDEWNKNLQNSTNLNIEYVYISSFVEEIMAVKDSDEIENLKVSGKFACTLMGRLIKNFESIIDDDKKVTHKSLSNQIKSLVEDNLNFRKQFKEKNKLTNVDIELLEMFLPPVIQSGGNYDLNYMCTIDDNNLSSDVLICKIGVRYKDYNSHLTRTYMIDSDKVKIDLINFIYFIINRLSKIVIRFYSTHFST